MQDLLAPAPPMWKNADECYQCRKGFGIFTHRHHCRNCGFSFCATHTSQERRLPHYAIHEQVRVCDACAHALDNPQPVVAAQAQPVAATPVSTAEAGRQLLSQGTYSASAAPTTTSFNPNAAAPPIATATPVVYSQPAMNPFAGAAPQEDDPSFCRACGSTGNSGPYCGTCGKRLQTVSSLRRETPMRETLRETLRET